jgi:hypothetical protein
MRIRATHLRGCLAIALAFAALGAPPAIAGRYGPPAPFAAGTARAAEVPRGTCHQYCEAVNQSAGRSTGLASPLVKPRIVTVTADTRFHWGDAAIGFGTALGAAFLTLGLVVLRRHRPLGVRGVA